MYWVKLRVHAFTGRLLINISPFYVVIVSSWRPGNDNCHWYSTQFLFLVLSSRVSLHLLSQPRSCAAIDLLLRTETNHHSGCGLCSRSPSSYIVNIISLPLNIPCSLSKLVCSPLLHFHVRSFVAIHPTSPLR
ncbi:hypothetical protein FRC19_005421 [Serendipita sp. 401]|nr:hypothetical protein FRC19_005421 [Serendipita sp. 401]